jgi:hypothetical protein
MKLRDKKAYSIAEWGIRIAEPRLAGKGSVSDLRIRNPQSEFRNRKALLCETNGPWPA